MALLIKGAHVYAPEDLGICDVLTVRQTGCCRRQDLSATTPELETIDAKWVDSHAGLY